MEVLIKMTFRVCANLTTMFTAESSSLLERYKLAASAGFKAVECAFPYEFRAEKVAEAKSAVDLKQVLINADPGPGGKGLAAIAGQEEAFQKSIEKSLEYCKALDCSKLHIMAGIAECNETNKQTYLKNLKSVVKLLEKANVVGLIEPINGYSVPGYFLHDFALAEEMVKQIASPFLKLQLDIFHLQFLKGDLTNSLKKLLPITGKELEAFIIFANFLKISV